MPLPAKAFDVLWELLKSAGTTVTKEQLMDAVWPGTFVEEGNLTQMIFLLRKALGDSGETSPYIVTVPRRGYRFVGRLTQFKSPGAMPQRYRHHRFLTPLALASVGAFVVGGLWLGGKRADRDAAIKAVAVLPFDDLSSGKNMDYFCQGMAEELIEALSQIPGLRVTARDSALQFKTTSDIRHADTKLGVQAVVNGSVRRDGELLRVTAELLRVHDGVRIWSETYEGSIKDTFAVQRAIARSVGETLRLRIGESLYAPRRYTSDLALYDLYLKGRSGSPGYCQQAADRNPSYALAFSCLADAYAGMWTAGVDPRAAVERARAAAAMALRLDSGLPEAHLSRARILVAPPLGDQ